MAESTLNQVLNLDDFFFFCFDFVLGECIAPILANLSCVGKHCAVILQMECLKSFFRVVKFIYLRDFMWCSLEIYVTEDRKTRFVFHKSYGWERKEEGQILELENFRQMELSGGDFGIKHAVVKISTFRKLCKFLC